jgi:hypothetical protein
MPEFLALKKQVYPTFYKSLLTAAQALDAYATPAEVKQHIALITAVIDGSVLQGTGSSKTFVRAVTSTVITKASGHTPQTERPARGGSSPEGLMTARLLRALTPAGRFRCAPASRFAPQTGRT